MNNKFKKKMYKLQNICCNVLFPIKVMDFINLVPNETKR